MCVAPSAPLIAREPLPSMRFDAARYLQMIETGVLGPDDKVELVGGTITPMSPAGSPHHHVLVQLTELFAPLLDRYHISVNGTLPVGDDDVYDPDFMLLVRKPGGYKKALPRPADVGLLIEASSASLHRDRAVKMPVYAAAGVREYWIADVGREVLIVHREPAAGGYDRAETLRGDDRVSPECAADFSVRVGDIFD